MTRIEVEAAIQLATRDLEALTGKSATTCTLIECDDALPTQCADHIHRLMTFRLEGYSPTFFVVGGQDTDHYFVIILMGEQGYQAFPNNPEDSCQFRTQELAEATFKEGIVLPFVVTLLSRMTPEKLDEWIAKCDAMNDKRSHTNMKAYDILDKMPFGKHAGVLVGTVIEEDPQYIFWAINNTDFRLNEKAYAYLKECLEDV